MYECILSLNENIITEYSEAFFVIIPKTTY